MQTDRQKTSSQVRMDGRDSDQSISLTPREKLLLSMVSTHKDPSESSAKLPESWVYDNIKDAIYHCRRIYYIFLGIICYTLLTVMTTPTLDLFRNQVVEMPIMNAKMPLHYYLIVAPLLLIGFFTYKQLYLYKTNKLIKYAVDECKRLNNGNCSSCEGKADECTISSICKDHESRLYPWIIIYCRFIEDLPGKGDGKDRLGRWVAKCQDRFVNYSLWGLLPVILVLLSVFVIKIHEIELSFYMLLVTCFGIGIVTFFWYHQQSILGRGGSLSATVARILIGSALIVLFLTGLNVMALNGKLTQDMDLWSQSSPWWAKAIQNISFADMSYQTISGTKGAVGAGMVVPEDSKFEGINFKGRHFEGANFSHTALKKANFKESYLEKAYFVKSTLSGADLTRGNADGATFSGASLENASFISASLNQTDFSDAKLQNAKFNSATLEGASFSCADLSGANFNGSYIKGASFYDSNLQNAAMQIEEGMKTAQLKEALNYQLAFYDAKWIAILSLPDDHNERVKAKNFSGYDFESSKLMDAKLSDANLTESKLSNSDLRGAILEKANFKDADLAGANFREAKLRNIRNAEVKQFSKVKTLYGADMDAPLKGELKKHYPHLFDNPSSE